MSYHTQDMGLGKTIQMIALIAANRAKPGKSQSKATLVVCTVSLMQQWESEIKSKTKNGLTVYIHHGSNRTKGQSFRFHLLYLHRLTFIHDR